MKPAMPRRRAPARRGGSRPQSVFGRDDRSMRAQPVMLNTADRRQWDGMLYRPLGRTGGRRRLGVVVVHGSVGNYVSGLPRRISFALAAAGFTVLAANTRMANYGVFFGGGLMHRTPLDLDAAVALMERLGFRRIVLLGFSMGATMVCHHQVLRRPASVVGVATLAHPASLPGSLARRWRIHGAVPGYDEVTEAARTVLRPDPEDPSNDRILVVRRANGRTDRPADAEIWTYRTWWFSRGPQAYHAISRLRVGHLTVPLALIQAGDDPIVPTTDGEELASIARRGSSPDVTLRTIAGADHVFSGYDAELTEATVGWLDRFIAGAEASGRVGAATGRP